jgi:hypothetical protein
MKKEEKTHPSKSPNHPLPTPLPNPSSSELPTRSTSGILAGPAITFLGSGTLTSGACENDGLAGAEGEEDITAWNAGPYISSALYQGTYLKPIVEFDRSHLHRERGVLGLRVQIRFSRGVRMFWDLGLLLMPLRLGCRGPVISSGTRKMARG